MLHHNPIVCRDIRFAFNCIDNNIFSLGSWRRAQFDKSRKTCTSHSRNACNLYSFDNFFGCQFGMCFHAFQLTTSINPFFPLITFYINDNDRLTITCCINRCIYLCYCSRYGTVDRSTHKTICLSYQCTYLYLISSLYDRPCRCSNMLPQRKYCSLRQSRFFCRNISCQLMFLWVHTTYSECK